MEVAWRATRRRCTWHSWSWRYGGCCRRRVPDITKLEQTGYEVGISAVTTGLLDATVYAQFSAIRVRTVVYVTEYTLTTCTASACRHLVDSISEKGYTCQGVDRSMTVIKLRPDCGCAIDGDRLSVERIGEVKFTENPACAGLRRVCLTQTRLPTQEAKPERVKKPHDESG